MAQFRFNTASAPAPAATSSYDPLPKGNYEMIVTASEFKPTKAGTGHYIEFTMQVISGEHSGRRHWERLNVDNPNQTAQEIAEAALASLCLACGVSDLEDTEQLHDIPFIARVDIDRKDPTRNRIMGYSSAQPAAPAPAPVKPAASAAPGKAARPWG